MYSVTQIKNNITAMGHGGTLNKVRNFESLLERAANTMLLKCRPLETIREAPLAQTIHDNLFNYSLASDFDEMIDVYPQANRTSRDQGVRSLAESFDRRRTIDDKKISIEAVNGVRIARIDWQVRSPKTLHNMDSYNGNGTWSAVATASGIATDTIYKYSGGGSVKFDVVASGDGIQITDMTAVDFTNEDEIADVVIPIYVGDTTNLTSITFIWGNDLTTNYWTGVAQTTQADGTAFQNGWNIIKVPWSTATESGTVVPATVDSAKITFATTGAISDIRVDNIQFSIGYPFNMKYYSKYYFQNSSGTWISLPTSDTDNVVLDNDGFQIYLLEVLKQMAQQLEGTDSAFDITFANNELAVLYPAFKRKHPNQAKKPRTHYGGLPRYSNSNLWRNTR